MLTKHPLISKWTNACAQQNVSVFKIRTSVPKVKQNHPSGAEKSKKLNNSGKGWKSPWINFSHHINGRTRKGLETEHMCWGMFLYQSAWRALTKWLKHPSKDSNKMFEKERLAWQAIASWRVVEHLMDQIFLREFVFTLAWDTEVTVTRKRVK